MVEATESHNHVSHRKRKSATIKKTSAISSHEIPKEDSQNSIRYIFIWYQIQEVKVALKQ